MGTIPPSAILSQSLIGWRGPNNLASTALGLLVPRDTNVESASASTDWPNFSTAATGVAVAGQPFNACFHVFVPATSLLLRYRAQVEVVTASGAGSVGRLNSVMTYFDAGGAPTVLDGAITSNTFLLDALATTLLIGESIQVNPRDFDAGGMIQLSHRIEVTVAAAGTVDVRLHHDASGSGNELVHEFASPENL